MIYCKQINEDRLGNQLFRFASAYCHARRNNDTLKVDWKNPIGKPYYIKGEPREDEILFNYVQPTLGYHEIPYIKGMNLDGYFQSEKYFKGFEKEVRQMFFTKKTRKRNGAIHVRRGDYLNLQGVLPVLPMDYYDRAIEYSIKNFGVNSFVVYTDDFDWCAENLKSIHVESISSKDSDFLYMQNHYVNIIANSTYSWWAAWLAGHDKVIAPKVWFGHQNEFFTDKDIVPERWVRL